MNTREPVHGTLNLRASDLLHVVESFFEKSSSLFHSSEDGAPLLLVLFDTLRRLAAKVGLIYHELHRHLANSVGAQLYRFEFVQELLCSI